MLVWCSVFGRAHRGSTAGFLLIQHFSVGLAVEYSSCLISVLNLDFCVSCFWCVWRGLRAWSRFKPHSNNVLLTVPRRCFGCCLLYSSMFVRFLFVFDFCSLCLGYPSGHLLGKSCPLGFPLTRELFYTWCRPKCLCSFLVLCLRQDVEFNCISSWSLPFHLRCCRVLVLFHLSVEFWYIIRFLFGCFDELEVLWVEVLHADRITCRFINHRWT